MSAIYRPTADASSAYRERTAVQVARSLSSSETGNLAAVTKNCTFQYSQIEQNRVVEMPTTQATTIKQP